MTKTQRILAPIIAAVVAAAESGCSGSTARGTASASPSPTARAFGSAGRYAGGYIGSAVAPGSGGARRTSVRYGDAPSRVRVITRGASIESAPARSWTVAPSGQSNGGFWSGIGRGFGAFARGLG